MEKIADGFRNDSQFLSYSRLGLLQFHIAGHFLNTWAHNLQFNNLPKELIAYFQHAGAQYHPAGMAESIWGTIPHSIRMAGPDTVREFLHTRDWSHFIPHSHGGGHGAGHGIFESLMLNRSRGAHPMTHSEILHAREILHSAALKQVMQNALEVTLTAGLIAIAVTAVLSIMENGLRYKQGELDHKELYGRVVKETIRNAAVSVAVSGIIIGLVLVFPLLMPVLSAVALPLAVVGFSMLGHRFYRLSAEWLKETDLTPAIEMWNTVAMETTDAVLWVTHRTHDIAAHIAHEAHLVDRSVHATQLVVGTVKTSASRAVVGAEHAAELVIDVAKDSASWITKESKSLGNWITGKTEENAKSAPMEETREPPGTFSGPRNFIFYDHKGTGEIPESLFAPVKLLSAH